MIARVCAPRGRFTLGGTVPPILAAYIYYQVRGFNTVVDEVLDYCLIFEELEIVAVVSKPSGASHYQRVSARSTRAGS
jgi:hypothetical protein